MRWPGNLLKPKFYQKVNSRAHTDQKVNSRAHTDQKVNTRAHTDQKVNTRAHTDQKVNTRPLVQTNGLEFLQCSCC